MKRDGCSFAKIAEDTGVKPETERTLRMKTLSKSIRNVAAALAMGAMLVGLGWAADAKKLPRLVDLGADKCIPCKMMAPVLADLKTNYSGRLEVEFIDVWKNPNAGKPYKIKLIPTQIFFDATGKERFRHQGFFSKEDILAKWKELGVDLDDPQAKAGGAKDGGKVAK